MSRIPPIPTTRVSTLFTVQRMAQQVANDQLNLFRVQNQVSTGRRLFLPSDDPPAALRGMTVQRLLERREQLQTNLDGSNSFLAAADSSLANASSIITNIRGSALGVAGTLATDEQRQSIVDQVDRALEQLVNTGNSTFRGRYLFSGSQSLLQPFDYVGDYVEYRGNEQNLRSHVDLGLLFPTNVPGNDVFGGISSVVQGAVDLNPHLEGDTLLRSLNGGAGLSQDGSISLTVSYGSQPAETAIIDLSGAATVGDIARQIEVGAPADAQLVVEVTGTGFRISSDSADVLNITIGEVSDGVTAKELGIYTDPASVQTTINGADLNPALTRTTRLNDLLGTKAQGRIISAGVNNDIILTGGVNGVQFNGVTVEFVAGGTAGSEFVSYDGPTTTLTVQVESGVSTAEQVAAAITTEGTFTAAVDVRDAISASVAGSGAVDAASFGVVTDNGGSGTALDQAAGLIVSNGNGSVTIDISQAETVQNLLNLFDGAGLNLLAEINDTGTGINVRSRISGADFTIAENGGITAEQLGIRTYTATTELADFNRGVGVVTETQRSFEIELDDGVGGITTFTVQLASLDTNGELVLDVVTVDDLIAEIAGVTGGVVTAQIETVGNGLVLTDNSIPPSVAMTVRGEVAGRLGFFDESVDPPEVVSTIGTLTAEDRHTQEVDSVFNTLIRLRTALEAGDVAEIGRSIERLDTDLDRLNFARSEVGARQQSLGNLSIRLEDDDVQLRSALSNDLDVDLVEAISNLTARQFALEASLRTSASILSLSILDFI